MDEDTVLKTAAGQTVKRFSQRETLRVHVSVAKLTILLASATTRSQKVRRCADNTDIGGAVPTSVD